MKLLTFITLALISFTTICAQEAQLKLSTDFGSDNKEINDFLRFEGTETVKLKFSGKQIKDKDYTLIVKEFTNGSLAKSDTIIDSKKNAYISKISDTIFNFKYYVKTQVDNKVKMTFMFNGFSSTKFYDVKSSEDLYALHDFSGVNTSISIPLESGIYVLGYFLPYLDKESGYKLYCEVSGIKHKPKDWGTVFNIPNYFLVEIKFE